MVATYGTMHITKNFRQNWSDGPKLKTNEPETGKLSRNVAKSQDFPILTAQKRAKSRCSLPEVLTTVTQVQFCAMLQIAAPVSY